MTDVRGYLVAFSQAAGKAGLQLKTPGENWVAMSDLVPGSHVSLSVRKNQIQVNLNNERDEDRRQFDRLFKERAAIADAIGQPLAWEKKDGRKKTAVRATFDGGWGDRQDWHRQHQWAVEMMQSFDREFGARLRTHESGSK